MKKTIIKSKYCIGEKIKVDNYICSVVVISIDVVGVVYYTLLSISGNDGLDKKYLDISEQELLLLQK